MDWRLPFLLRTLIVRSRLLTNFKLEPLGWVFLFSSILSKSENRVVIFALQGQLYQPLECTSSFRRIQTIWYRTWNGRICSWEVRFFTSPLLHTADLPFYSLSALCFSSFSQLYEYQICTHQPRTSHVKNKEKNSPRCSSISIFYHWQSCMYQEIEWSEFYSMTISGASAIRSRPIIRN